MNTPHQIRRAGFVTARDTNTGREQEASPFAPAGSRPAAAPFRIAVVGGGAGGLELAVLLARDCGKHGDAEIVLVDPHTTHLWKPLLHEAAAGTLTPDEGEIEFLQLARRHRFRFHLGTLTGLDRRRKEILLAPLKDEDGREIAPARPLWYDVLVIAIGARDNDFGIPGVREFAMTLNDAGDAERFHRRLLALLGAAEMRGGGPVRVAIVGGGATGVELAAELVEAARVLASYGLHLKRYPSAVKLTVVDTATRLLPAMPEVIGVKAADDLRRMGVDLVLGRKVTAVGENRLEFTEGQQRQTLDCDITVWAAGIRCAEVLHDLDGLESNHLNQLVVRPTLQTTRDDDVFALGDCAFLAPAANEGRVPPKAQAAHQEARLLAHSLARHLKGEPLRRFTFHDRGSLVTLGHREAIGNLVEVSRQRLILVEGLLARISYWFLYRRFLLTVLGVRQTLMTIIAGWFSARTQPRVKLH